MSSRKLLNMNPIKLHFYQTFLWLFEYGTKEEMRDYCEFLYQLNLPPKIQRMVYRAKHKAKCCPDRKKELALLSIASVVIGFKVKPDGCTVMAYYEKRDPIRKEALFNYFD